ncbi:MAG: hypothetical protein VYD54_13385, partial [Bdellovibrionota bacterium]|nr:hypothetical protein [Bdellovibrionota bacterium]
SINNINKFFPEKESQLSFQKIIQETLILDPRPGHHRSQKDLKTYGFRLLDFDVIWSARNDNFFVEKVIKTEESHL